ncbi:hypothetical protein [Roseibium salinum]|uniref:Uncharacterized protein n=1 Tax=Roseibium salinum TaxID=1604349 RepID=A0ABT3R6K6_9HYPH|nr:hypothetical protein [Roseibium sp. DSM 29163]MCX2724771.1 hypothetical protein [Roseibium sp. DSM 29163]
MGRRAVGRGFADRTGRNPRIRADDTRRHAGLAVVGNVHNQGVAAADIGVAVQDAAVFQRHFQLDVTGRQFAVAAHRVDDDALVVPADDRPVPLVDGNRSYAGLRRFHVDAQRFGCGLGMGRRAASQEDEAACGEEAGFEDGCKTSLSSNMPHERSPWERMINLRSCDCT